MKKLLMIVVLLTVFMGSCAYVGSVAEDNSYITKGMLSITLPGQWIIESSDRNEQSYSLAFKEEYNSVKGGYVGVIYFNAESFNYLLGIPGMEDVIFNVLTGNMLEKLSYQERIKVDTFDALYIEGYQRLDDVNLYNTCSVIILADNIYIVIYANSSVNDDEMKKKAGDIFNTITFNADTSASINTIASQESDISKNNSSSNYKTEEIFDNMPAAQESSIDSNALRNNSLYSYEIKGNGTVSIVGYDWSRSIGDIYIPSMLDGYAVTAIGEEAFANGKNTKTVDVMVVIPNSITTIGEKAFFNSPISSISIPISIKTIGKAAFAYCDITQFIVDQQQANYATIDGALYDKRTRTLLAHPQRKTISSKIPEGIQCIGEYAFSGMTIGQNGSPALCLNDILPSTLIKIEAHAFENCTLYYSSDNSSNRAANYNSDRDEMSLLPASVALIDQYAFAGCSFKCNSNSVPKAIVIAEIGDYAFNGCGFYDGYEYDLIISKNDMERIGKNAFASVKVNTQMSDKMKTRIHLPKAIEEIDDNAFFETHPVCLMENTEIRNIGQGVFQNTIVYTEMDQETIPVSLSIPGKLRSIPSMAFAYGSEDGLNTVEKIEIQDGVRKIEDSAFAGRENLKTVILPLTLREIGDRAFNGCKSISEISVPESVTEIGDAAFERAYVTLIVKEDSYASIWASENGYNYRYEENSDNLDWLNSDIH